MRRKHKPAQVKAFVRDHHLNHKQFFFALVKAGKLDKEVTDKSASTVSNWVHGRRSMSDTYQKAYEILVLQRLDLALQEMEQANASMLKTLETITRYGEYLGEGAVFSALFKVFAGIAADKQALVDIVTSDLKDRLRAGIPTGVGRALGMP